MARPIAPGPATSSPPPPSHHERAERERIAEQEFKNHLKRNWIESPPEGAKAMSAPTTPVNELPVIDRTTVDPQVLKSAQGMEAMYLNQVMQAMRKTVPKSDLSLDSHATKIYQSMMDSEFAEKASKNGGVGLADQIIAYLQASGYNVTRGNHSPNTNEGAVGKQSGKPTDVQEVRK